MVYLACGERTIHDPLRNWIGLMAGGTGFLIAGIATYNLKMVVQVTTKQLLLAVGFPSAFSLAGLVTNIAGFANADRRFRDLRQRFVCCGNDESSNLQASVKSLIDRLDRLIAKVNDLSKRLARIDEKLTTRL